MTAFVIAAIVMLVALIPAGMTLIRGTLADSVVGYQFISTVTVLILALLAEGFGRPGLFEFPVLLAVLPPPQPVRTRMSAASTAPDIRYHMNWLKLCLRNAVTANGV